jgi:hypothetical protein
MSGLQRMSPDHRARLAELMREWLSGSGLDLSIAAPMLMEDEA